MLLQQRQCHRLLGGAQAVSSRTAMKAAQGRVRVQTPGACCVPWSSVTCCLRLVSFSGRFSSVFFSLVHL